MKYTLGDFGCHILDPIFTALGLTAPTTIRVENEGMNSQTWPVAETVSYVFPGTDLTAAKTLPVTWWDGGRQPDAKLAQMPDGEKLPDGGSLIIGEAGTMVLPHVGMPKLYPVEKFKTFEIKKEPGASHYHAWVDGCLSGKRTTDGFHYAGPLAETVQLGNVATRVPGIDLVWDAAELKFKNSPEANALVSKKYRAGWEVPAAS